MAQDWGGTPGLNPYAADWSGAYAGLHSTTGDADSHYRASSYEIGSFKGAGVQVGYMQDFGYLVAGAEIAYSALRLADDGVDSDSNYLQLKARLGRDTGAFMPYVTAGVGRMTEEDWRENAVIFGLGVAVTAQERLILGVEYTRNHFADVRDGEIGSGLDLDLDMIQLSAAMRF